MFFFTEIILAVQIIVDFDVLITTVFSFFEIGPKMTEL